MCLLNAAKGVKNFKTDSSDNLTRADIQFRVFVTFHTVTQNTTTKNIFMSKPRKSFQGLNLV